MVQVRFYVYARWLGNSILTVLLLTTVACSSTSQSVATSGSPGSSHVPSSTAAGLLPSGQLWKDNVPSFIFGTNDSQEWATNNIQTVPGIQQALKAAHFTLMRTFFFDKSLADGHPTTDAEIEARIATVENSGMTCMGVLPRVYNVAFDTHLVTLLGKRCNIYEFGNEPDYNGIAIHDYITQWNLVIPRLKKINPQARFIGGAGAGLNYTQQFLEGAKASGVLPDAIDIHWYPCWKDTPATCLPKATSVIADVQQYRAMIQATVGYALPVGVGEWNMDPGSNFSLGNNAAFMAAFTKIALNSLIQLKVIFANQFEAANYGGYGALDMFNLGVSSNPPKTQYYVMKRIISKYLP